MQRMIEICKKLTENLPYYIQAEVKLDETLNVVLYNIEGFWQIILTDNNKQLVSSIYPVDEIVFEKINQIFGYSNIINILRELSVSVKTILERKILELSWQHDALKRKSESLACEGFYEN